MFRNLLTSRYLGIFLVFFLLSLYLVVQLINGRFSMYDFEVYYRAAGRILQAENLYRPIEDGHYYFKYAPVSAIYFLPFTIFGLQMAKVIFWLLSAGIIAHIVLLSVQMAGGWEGSSSRRVLMITLLTFMIHLVFIEFEIHLGQVNIILLWLYLLAIRSYQKDHWFLVALYLALSLFIKPFGLILLPFLILRRQWSSSIGFIVLVTLLAALPLLFFRSVHSTIDQYQLWLGELVIELGNKQDLLLPGNHSMFSLILRYSPLRWFVRSENSQMVYQLCVLIALAAGFLILIVRIREKSYHEFILMSLLVAMIPLLAYTNINLFMFVLPLTAIVLVQFMEMKVVFRILAVAGMILLGFNWRDLWGYTLADKYEEWSLLAIGAMMLVVTGLRLIYHIKPDTHSFTKV